MKLAFRSLIAFLAVAAPFSALADEWPMFGGRPDRNSVSAEKGLPKTWDGKKKENIKWVADLGKDTFGNPVIAGGRVFIGTSSKANEDKSVLMSFSTADGKLLWQAVHEKLPGGMMVDAPNIGICSTPCVKGDFVYYVSNRNELICCKAADGTRIWLLDMRTDLGALQDQAAVSSPLVIDNLVFVVTGNGHDSKAEKVVNPKAPSFIAVNAATGKIVWQDSSPGERILSSQWSSPAYAVIDGVPQVAFPGGDGWIYAFDPPTGKLIWKFNCKAHEKLDAEGKPESKNTLVGSPVYAGHRLLIATGVDTETSGPGCLRAVDARQKGDVTKTAELWKFEGEEFGVSISNVTVHDGLVFATELAGYVNCIDLANGKRYWRHDLLSQVWGTPLVAEGKVYVRTGDEEVVVFEASREKKLIGKNDTLPGMGHGSVIASDGVIYLAGKTKLWAIAETK